MSQPMLTRRSILAASAAAPAAALSTSTLSAATAKASNTDRIEGLRLSLAPDKDGDQSAEFRNALARAQATGRPLFLPPGRYEIANIDLPANAQIVGIPGESIIVYHGNGSLFRTAPGDRLRLTGLTIDGSQRPLSDEATALISATGITDVKIIDCTIKDSARNGIALQACGGHIENCTIVGSRFVGVHLLESTGMTVTGNRIEKSGNTGILIQRWEKSEDRTIVRGNQIVNTAALSGGTGQYGNAINVAKANGVVITDNQIDKSYYSGIRVFSSDNSQITGNVITRSGEVALYVEFAFEGAIVSDNLIDDAAFGISFANMHEYGGRLSVCSGNLVRNLRDNIYSEKGRSEGTGVGIGAEADVAITGNVVENAPAIGIHLGWGEYLRDIAATGNVVRNAPIGIAVSVVEG
ncbi:MAG: TIGR03808 family TAT-translocated repetitive protein, partial [Alphaproteobacteria bacterium]